MCEVAVDGVLVHSLQGVGVKVICPPPTICSLAPPAVLLCRVAHCVCVACADVLVCAEGYKEVAAARYTHVLSHPPRASSRTTARWMGIKQRCLLPPSAVF